MPDMNQQRTDVEAAKERLQQINNDKEARRPVREGEVTIPARRVNLVDSDKEIRPVEKKPKKKKFTQKLKEAMFAEDIGTGSVTEYVFFKIVVPSIKRILSETANTMINMALGLDPRTRTIGNDNGHPHTVNASLYRDRNYNRPADSQGYSRRDALSEYEWDEETAKDILNQMQDLVDKYGECSLSDAYSIASLGHLIRTTDRNWGWTSLRSAEVVPVDRMHDRWIIDVPSARPLK